MYKLDNEIIDIFNELMRNEINCDENTEIYLSPAGEMSKEIYSLAIENGLAVKGFIDKGMGGAKVLSTPTFNYSDIKNIAPKKVVVCHGFYDKEIYDALVDTGIEDMGGEIHNLTCYVRNYYLKQYRKQFKQRAIKANSNKILLCRARGGFNDALSQITKCLVYAQKYNRALYIDTTRSGFLDCYSNYFESSHLFEFGVPEKPNTLTVFPSELQGRVDEYIAEQKWECNIVDGKEVGTLSQYRDNLTGTEVTFDFSKDYDEDLLVHEQEGRTDYAVVGLETLKVKKVIAHDIMQKIQQLGKFQGVHIRNTDFKTNYKDYLDKLSAKLEGDIVFCTDDYACLTYAKKVFGPRLISVSDIPDTKGLPLHGNKNIERYKTNIDSLRDLFVLSAAEKIHRKTLDSVYLQIGEDVVDVKLHNLESGFYILANNLCQDKNVLFDILNVSTNTKY